MRAEFTVTYKFDNKALKKIANENCVDLSKDNEDRFYDLYDALCELDAIEIEDYSVDKEEDLDFEEDDDESELSGKSE